MYCFITDGDMEKDFLEKICSRKHRIRKVPNSKNLSAERMTEFIETHVRELIDHQLNFVIWVDHEGKDVSPIEYENAIRERLGPIINDATRLYIGIADRMKENWMLADPDAIMQHYGSAFEYETTYEGCGGKTALKRHALSCGDSYIERVDGVDILTKCVPETMARNSPSAERFFSQLGDFDCWWLQRRPERY